MNITKQSATRVLDKIAATQVESVSRELIFDVLAGIEAIHHELKDRSRNQMLGYAWLNSPDALTANDALRMLVAKVNSVLTQIRQIDEVFDAAKAEIEASYAGHDAVVAKRIDAISETINRINTDFEQKVRNQESNRQAFESMQGKGFTPAAILALGISEPTHDPRDQRNAWVAEQKSLLDPLLAERNALLRFKHTRNETLLSPAVVAELTA